MTTPVYAISANSLTAETFRQAPSSLLSGGGVVGSGSLQVTALGTPNMSVNVAPGQVWVPGTLGSTSGFGPNGNAQTGVTSFTQQGSYFAWLASTTNVPISAADPSNPRIDLICAYIQDAAYSGSNNQIVVGVITGTPNASPSPPSAPSSSVVVGQVEVPAGASSITSGDITNVAPSAYLQPSTFNGRANTGSNITANSGDHVLVSTGSPTITLPAPFRNARVKVTNYGTGTVTVQHSSSESIFGAGTTSSGQASILLGAVGATVTLESDGTSWYITAGQQDSGQIALSSLYVNSWTDLGGAYQTGQYRKQGNIVTVSGAISGGANNSNVCTLPTGYRPKASRAFASVNANFGTAVAESGFVGIQNNGTISVLYTGGTGIVGLDGITFTVD